MNKHKNKHDMIKDIIEAWDLNNSVSDKEVLIDVDKAMQEAFMAGAMAGGMDKDIFEEALDFFDKEVKIINRKKSYK